jgi:hypothetical protein
MTITQIKQAVDNGMKVYWSNEGYEVIKDNIDQYLIHCNINDSYIGLHGLEGTKYDNVLNGDEKDFYIKH